MNTMGRPSMIGSDIRIEIEGDNPQTIDCPKSIAFDWLNDTFHTVSFGKIVGEPVDDIDIDELKSLMAKYRIEHKLEIEKSHAEHIVAEKVAKDGDGFLEHIASWFWPGTAESFSASGLSAVNDTDEWQLFGPWAKNYHVWERLITRLPAGRWYWMIKRDRYDDMQQILDMMNTKKGGKQ